MARVSNIFVTTWASVGTWTGTADEGGPGGQVWQMNREGRNSQGQVKD